MIPYAAYVKRDIWLIAMRLLTMYSINKYSTAAIDIAE